MSFSMQFTATSLQSAHDQLRKASAPIGVKSLAELALAKMPWPRPAHSARPSSSDGAGTAGSNAPRFIGVRVESYGHIDDGSDRSWIERFVVEPLFE